MRFITRFDYRRGRRDWRSRSNLPARISKGAKMHHATALRAIGQSLEAARVGKFEIENRGNYYLVLSNSLTHRLVRLSSTQIQQLDARGRKEREHQSFSRTPSVNRLSQLLRNLGEHLDSAGTRAFHISWMSHSVLVNYERPAGPSETRTFTAKELRQLGSQSCRRQTRLQEVIPIRDT
jgi:hypothetical protein